MKKIKLLLLACLIPLAGIAQETPEVVKAKIKEIKLSEKYVYAETTSTQSETEAQQNAVDLLRRNVLSLLTEKEGDPIKAEKVWSEKATNYEKLAVATDSLFRVFVYLPKESLSPATAASTPALSEEDFLFKAPKEEDTRMDEATIQRFFSQMEMVEAKPQKVDSAVAEKAPVQVEVSETKQEETVEATPVEATPVEIAPVEAAPLEVAPVEAVPVQVASPTPAPLRKELQEMLSLKTYKEVMAYLNREKGEGRAIYGRIKTMTAPAKSYLLVVRNGEMVTILDKGAGIRINLKTNQAESIRNYVGYAVIWFQLF